VAAHMSLLEGWHRRFANQTRFAALTRRALSAFRHDPASPRRRCTRPRCAGPVRVTFPLETKGFYCRRQGSRPDRVRIERKQQIGARLADGRIVAVRSAALPGSSWSESSCHGQSAATVAVRFTLSQMTRHVLARRDLVQQRCIHLAARHRVGATGVEVTTAGRMHRARHVALQRGSGVADGWIGHRDR